MSYSDYSYLDLTVMTLLRKRVISQDAAVLFTAALDRVLWANASGAKLFSGSGLADLIDARLSPSQPLVRQIALALKQDDEEDEPVYRQLRINHGLNSELVGSRISRELLPNGEEVVLLVCPRDPAERRLREYQLAMAAVESLEDFAHAAAILDNFGLVLAASESFGELDIDPAVLEALVSEAEDEADRLVKRPIETGTGIDLPAGLGKIRDHPARFLVVLADPSEATDAADEDKDNSVAGDADAWETGDLPPWLEVAGEEEASTDATVATAALAATGAAAAAGLAASAGDWQAAGTSGTDAARLEDETRPQEDASAIDRGEADRDEAVFGEDIGQPDLQAEDDRHHDEEEPASADGAAAAPEFGRPGRSLLDRWYFDEHRETARTGIPQEEPSRAATAGIDAVSQPDDAGDREVRSVSPRPDADVERFAFTIDRDQVFRSVSEGLARAVGKRSADLVGQHWSDVARRRGFDENGAILKLLSKADTWSGRSVLWPIEGTDMTVPVDLAALPSYDRERNFDGFRGFGVIRMADAMVDPNAIGMRFSEEYEAAADEASPPEADADEFDNARDDFVVMAPEGTASDADESGPSGEDDIETHVTGWDNQEDEPDAEDPSIEREGSQDKPLRWADTVQAANVYRLSDRRSRTEEETARAGGADNGANDRDSLKEGGEDDAIGLTGRERRNFTEISRSLRTEDASTRESPDDARSPVSEGGAIGDQDEAEFEPEEPAEFEESVATREENESAQDAADDGEAEPVAAMPDLPQGASLVLQGGHMLFASPDLLRLTGYDDTDSFEAAGGLDALIMGEAEVDHVAAQGPDPRTGNAMLIRHRDGHAIPVRCRLKRIDWQGETALSLSFHEVGRDEARDTPAIGIARSSELQGMLDQVADGIAILDGGGRIISINPAAEDLFGRDQAGVIGQDFAALFSTADREPLRDYVRTLAANHDGARVEPLQRGYEATGLSSQDGTVPLFVTLGRVGSDGNLCAVLRDLTDWKRTERELVAARKEAENASDQKSQFLSRVSHEIREPLTAIVGFSDLMLEERYGPVGNERYRGYLKDINRSGNHVLDLVNDLLDISKIESGKLDLSFEAVDLNRVVSESVSLLQPQASNRRILVRTSLSSAIPKVVADLRSMRQIVLNLLANAINHSPENTQVILSTTLEENGEVSLRIRDNGDGMSDAQVRRALEGEGASETGSEDTGAGKATSRTGMGLPLTKALVEANRAYFELDSTPGEGTVVHVVFPSQRVLSD